MDTKQRILEIAYDEFAENGFEKTALATISDKLGITRPALYYHFTSKEELFLAVYNAIDPFPKIDITCALEAEDVESYRVALQAILQDLIGNYRTDTKRAQFIAHVQHASLYLPSVIEAAKTQDGHLRTVLRTVLEHGLKLNCFRDDFSVEVGVDFLVVTVYGIGEVMLRGTEVPLNVLAPMVFDGLFK